MATRKAQARRRRARGTRTKIFSCSERVRLSVYKSKRHFYAQLFSPGAEKVLFSASTLSSSIKDECTDKTRSGMASALGGAVGRGILKLGIKEVAFDRGGFRYHGHVERIAEAARTAGLSF